MDPRAFLDEKIELVVSESQLMISNIRQDINWRITYESLFADKLKVVEDMLKEKRNDPSLIEAHQELEQELEQLRREAGPASVSCQDGEQSEDAQGPVQRSADPDPASASYKNGEQGLDRRVQHSEKGKTRPLDVQTDLELEEKLIQEIIVL